MGQTHTPETQYAMEKQLSEDVAVLRAQVGALQGAVNKINDSFSSGFSQLSARMEIIGSLVKEVAVVQERQSAHSDGLARNFARIEQVERERAEESESFDRWKVQHERDTAKADKTHSRHVGIAIGISLCLSVIISLVVWFAKDTINQTRENTQRIHQLQLEEARRHGAPIGQ